MRYYEVGWMILKIIQNMIGAGATKRIMKEMYLDKGVDSENNNNVRWTQIRFCSWCKHIVLYSLIYHQKNHKIHNITNI